jgi:hypothetical protein
LTIADCRGIDSRRAQSSIANRQSTIINLNPQSSIDQIRSRQSAIRNQRAFTVMLPRLLRIVIVGPPPLMGPVARRSWPLWAISSVPDGIVIVPSLATASS